MVEVLSPGCRIEHDVATSISIQVPELESNTASILVRCQELLLRTAQLADKVTRFVYPNIRDSNDAGITVCRQRQSVICDGAIEHRIMDERYNFLCDAIAALHTESVSG